MKAVLKRVHDDFAKDVSPQAEPKDHKARSKFATWSKSVNIGQLLLMREKLPLPTSGISEPTSGSLPPHAGASVTCIATCRPANLILCATL